MAEKRRVHEIAKAEGLPALLLVQRLRRAGFDVSHQSSVDVETALHVLRHGTYDAREDGHEALAPERAKPHRSFSRTELEDLLFGTPYLIGDGAHAVTRFGLVAHNADETRSRAELAAAAVASTAESVLPQLRTAITSDLVSESLLMEGEASSTDEVSALAVARRDLLELEVGGLLECIRDDPKLLGTLGLFRAYAIADEWATSSVRPREFEIRSLHALIVPELSSAGQYKTKPNAIGGSSHTTTPLWSLQQEMSDLARWFSTGTDDPVLDAAVVHAWLTHIHPFDDGNGRMARLLANLALVQQKYPPLLLRSQSDRGRYLDALAASDTGDILPLYDLFVRSLRRTVISMEKPRYVMDKIRGNYLATVEGRYLAWLNMAEDFLAEVKLAAERHGWVARRMGVPDLEGFDLLESGDSAGNTWFLKLRRGEVDEWLLWFGFRSAHLRQRLADRPAPSMFVSRRTHDDRAVHPFAPVWTHLSEPLELTISVGRARPVIGHLGSRRSERTIQAAASDLMGLLVRATP